MSIARDVGVTGFDPMLWMLDPELTTLSFPMAQIAEGLVDRCLRAVDHDPGITEGSYITPVITEGNSV